MLSNKQLFKIWSDCIGYINITKSRSIQLHNLVAFSIPSIALSYKVHFCWRHKLWWHWFQLRKDEQSRALSDWLVVLWSDLFCTRTSPLYFALQDTLLFIYLFIYLNNEYYVSMSNTWKSTSSHGGLCVPSNAKLCEQVE